VNTTDEQKRIAKMQMDKLSNAKTFMELAEFWRACMIHYGYSNCLILTPAERGMLKNLNQRLESIQVTDFIKWCIENWDRLRRPHEFESETPSFKEIFYHKNDLLNIMTHENPKLIEDNNIIITRLEDIPKDHEFYEMLVRALRARGRVLLPRQRG